MEKTINTRPSTWETHIQPDRHPWKWKYHGRQKDTTIRITHIHILQQHAISLPACLLSELIKIKTTNGKQTTTTTTRTTNPDPYHTHIRIYIHLVNMQFETTITWQDIHICLYYL